MLVKVETLEISYRGANVMVTKNDPSEMYINPKKIINAVPVDLPTGQKLWFVCLEGMTEPICIDDNDFHTLI